MSFSSSPTLSASSSSSDEYYDLVDAKDSEGISQPSSVDIHFPEDSLFYKLLACIPIIGTISTLLNEGSLRVKIIQSKNIQQTNRLINVQNHYKIAAIIRELLSVAIVIASLAVGMLGVIAGVKMVAASQMIGDHYITFLF